MKKKLLFISCEEAHHICDKSQYGEASAWEKFKLGIRLSWCKITQTYTKRNKALTKVMKDSQIKVLDPNEVVDIKQNFDEQLANQQK